MENYSQQLADKLVLELGQRKQNDNRISQFSPKPQQLTSSSLSPSQKFDGVTLSKIIPLTHNTSPTFLVQEQVDQSKGTKSIEEILSYVNELRGRNQGRPLLQRNPSHQGDIESSNRRNYLTQVQSNSGSRRSPFRNTKEQFGKKNISLNTSPGLKKKNQIPQAGLTNFLSDQSDYENRFKRKIIESRRQSTSNDLQNTPKNKQQNFFIQNVNDFNGEPIDQQYDQQKISQIKQINYPLEDVNSIYHSEPRMSLYSQYNESHLSEQNKNLTRQMKLMQNEIVCLQEQSKKFQQELKIAKNKDNKLIQEYSRSSRSYVDDNQKATVSISEYQKLQDQNKELLIQLEQLQEVLDQIDVRKDEEITRLGDMLLQDTIEGMKLLDENIKLKSDKKNQSIQDNHDYEEVVFKDPYNPSIIQEEDYQVSDRQIDQMKNQIVQLQQRINTIEDDNFDLKNQIKDQNGSKVDSVLKNQKIQDQISQNDDTQKMKNDPSLTSIVNEQRNDLEYDDQVLRQALEENLKDLILMFEQDLNEIIEQIQDQIHAIHNRVKQDIENLPEGSSKTLVKSFARSFYDSLNELSTKVNVIRREKIKHIDLQVGEDKAKYEKIINSLRLELHNSKNSPKINDLQSTMNLKIQNQEQYQMIEDLKNEILYLQGEIIEQKLKQSQQDEESSPVDKQIKALDLIMQKYDSLSASQKKIGSFKPNQQ